MYLFSALVLPLTAHANNSLEKKFTHDTNLLIVKNKSDTDIYAATYLKRTLPFDCTIISEIQKIPAQSFTTFERPEGQMFYGRRLLFAKDEASLKPTFEKDEYHLAAHKSLRYINGTKFYITSKDNVLHCSNQFEWNIIKPIANFVTTIKNKILKALLKKVSVHEYSNTEATVRVQEDISESEKIFLEQRRDITQKALEEIMETSLLPEEVPNIAVCFSGGSYRAMIAEVGSLIALEKMGLLDCVTHICTLSGSCWIAPWTCSEASLLDYREQLKKNVKMSLIITPLNIKKTSKLLLTKMAFKQKISLIDFFGASLATRLLSDLAKNPYKIYLSKTSEHCAHGKNPLMIYTAVDATTDYNWFEMTPYEIGSIKYNAYVPTWAFGRKFVNGKSENFAPEHSLGYCMGICGASFAASFEEISEALKKSTAKDFYDLVDFITSQPDWGTIRLSPLLIYNPTYGLDNCPNKNVKRLTFVDAGVDGNLPFPPVLRKERKIDIILAMDFSEGVKKSNTLKKAEAYAKKYNLKFPKIDYTNVAKNLISVFKDENDPSVPTIIYVPLIKNESYSQTFDPEKETSLGYCSSANFAYSGKQFEELIGLPEFTLIEQKNVIINTIKEAISSKNRAKMA